MYVLYLITLFAFIASLIAAVYYFRNIISFAIVFQGYLLMVNRN